MAIIRASRTFEGGDLTQRSSTYIKSGTRIVDFKNKENGVYLYILGGYKTDSAGAGVWYRPLKIRDNFGMGLYKEKFAVQPNCPVEYFASKVQTFAPQMAKSEQVKDDAGKTRWVYPAWGRTAWRVLYNAAIHNEFGSGVHVLDLPQSGGASVIDEYTRGKQEDNTPNPELTDYEKAIVVNIKLDLKASGQPWKIQINPGRTLRLPVELADTEYLYNLDEVINYPSKDQLIEKLKSIVPSDIFRKGMDGYSDGPTTVSMSIPATHAASPEVAEPLVSSETELEVNPMMALPKAPSIPKATIAPTMSIPKANAKAETASDQATPFVSDSDALKAAMSYMKSKKQ